MGDSAPTSATNDARAHSLGNATVSTVPSLSAALASSIRHHARVIDGRDQQPQPTLRGGVPVKASYEDDDDHVSLSPAVELGFEKEARAAIQQRHYEGVRLAAPALLDFVANPRHEAKSPGGRSFLETSGQVVGRDDAAIRKFAISSWFQGEDSAQWSGKKDKAVRFASDDAGLAAAISSGKPLDPSRWGRSSFVAPPPTSFRVATRHPSHYFGTGGYCDRRAADAGTSGVSPSSQTSWHKRHRRNDQLLRLVVAILCFGVSLTFALFFGGGKLGMAMSSAAYERKMGKGSLDKQTDDLELFYPVWWRDEAAVPDMEAKNVELTGVMEFNVADIEKPRAPGRIETPFLWLIPKSGANVIRTALSACLRLVEASDLGEGSDQNVLIVQEINQQRFVNVDMTSSEGLERAKALNLASSKVPDIVISDILQGTLEVFNNRNRARLFAVFRHPLERAISKYYSDLSSDPTVAGFTLPQYVRSGGSHVENNYLTRYLSGQYSGTLSLEHLDYAREFLRKKVVIGLARDLPTSASVFNRVFQWNTTSPDQNQMMSSVDDCYENIFNALSDKTPPAIEEGSEGWKLLVAQNWFDLKVYEYIEYLFDKQLKQLNISPRL
ncbi:hypothetical protein HJC23_012360 [Cyclotella cryptica]|uniref:Sulfotransferase domain-containing protein n=1 Tax=Cyclotella cryptica TaxID=29204 RepID=A0ABD3QCI0_9STRA|eukprot:CCRYP_006584-RA/>CCRYP_006584-RA protein AED:0.01 eAED:0.01 QI:103/1/1/1/1/1/3/1333/610